MNITYAGRNELYEMAAFLNACWQAEYSRIVAPEFLGDMSVEERHKMLLIRFDEGTSTFLIMQEAEKMIGAAVLGKSFTDGYPDDGEISAIYLHHDFIGKGYGHTMFTKMEQLLIGKGYAHFVLDVLSENTRAVNFYRAHGYQKAAGSHILLGENSYPLTVFRKVNPLVIRQENPADYPAVYELTKAAFADMEYADGDEQEVVERLRKRAAFIPELSLVAELDGRLVGHILFTEMTVGGHPALCLGPISVLPELHRQGIGGALIRKGHKAAQTIGFSVCVLVGHKDYYPRFGYELAGKYDIEFPLNAPDECKMVKFLDGRGKAISGIAVFPPEFIPEG